MIFLMEASISMHCALNLEVWKLKQIEWKEKKKKREESHSNWKKKISVFLIDAVYNRWCHMLI